MAALFILGIGPIEIVHGTFGGMVLQWAIDILVDIGIICREGGDPVRYGTN
jgi:hypothetical protein